ncbi:betaine/proline/choline family ABC transporter ATP-binding protein [Pontimonas sp.]|jgi:osmoprotectant transport system ATP-binding protein|uniref:ABC transporter ATP-binding protein n=1 Tax=Pontimonas sp. TaxID=2304492 RepID=UPI00287000AC|nr:betaine/proline/choline family ABC transporter ATP-binding protein [Pontimonas sp.]MDR9396198.1 betaine/proline/choline family ABC transporter ATP-binding protein [Pontimonas sp.]MDR9434511.1 betaine/proline/choline family ABC transporter ATP-binding protein [Pontimonas sp.]
MTDDVLIRLEDVTKQYGGTEEPAVNSLTLEVIRGEVLVLVGPSGCGKSTTLRLINRLIEPSSGKLFLDGEDVTSINASMLRRKIGYVIQQVGLFPHRTIAENIATVPKLLGWDKKKIDERVDELLEVVSMDPKTYRERYPKELSGGQAQRVGVARALAADPDVLLMDEPFGAIDPITRDRLQNEFLRLQQDLKKTIVFVTHDIDEAIKMGNRIAILREGSEIAQLDTPEAILADPADEFVENFLGSGAILKSLTLAKIKDLELHQVPVLKAPVMRDKALETLQESEDSTAILLDKDDKPLRWLDQSALNRTSQPIEKSGRPITVDLQPEDTLQDALTVMLQSSTGLAAVTDRKGTYLGCATIESLANLIVSGQGSKN